MAVMGEEKNFTSGSINRAIFMLAVPMVLEMIMESLFAVVDVFYVSRVGDRAVTIVGLTESVITIVYATGIGLAMTATAFVARRTGEKKMKEAAYSAGQAIMLAVFISLSISIAGIFFGDDILRLMGASAEVVKEGTPYARIALGSNIIIMLLFLNNAVFRGSGDASRAMRSLWLANLLNIALGPLFIFVFDMGVTGAAVATTIGRSIGVCFQLWMLFSGRSLIKLSVEDLRVKFSLLWEMLKISMGGIGQFLLNSASWIVLMRIVSMFGDNVVAGYTVAVRVIVFTILPSWGLANAAATLVGQNLGAGQPDRAERSVWKAAFYNMLFLTAVAIVFFITAPYILSLFSGNPVVIQHGVSFLRIICPAYILFAYGMVMGQAFNGAGDTRTPTLMNFFCFWIVQVLGAYVMAVVLKMGVNGVYIAIAIANCVFAVIGILLFRRGKWRQVKV